MVMLFLGNDLWQDSVRNMKYASQGHCLILERYAESRYDFRKPPSQLLEKGFFLTIRRLARNLIEISPVWILTNV